MIIFNILKILINKLFIFVLINSLNIKQFLKVNLEFINLK